MMIINPYNYVLTASDSTLLEGIVGYWKMDEASGTAADLVGTNDLAATNNPVSTTGQVDDARAFVLASSQYLSKASPSGLAFNAGDGAISLWVNPATDTGLQTIINWGMQAVNVPYIWMYLNGGALSVQFVDGLSGFNTMNTGVSFAVSTWAHIALNFDRSGNLTVYKNNSLVSTHDLTAHQGSWSPANAFYVGAYQGIDSYFNGALDELKIWHRVLTVDEIDEDYDNGVAGNPLM